MKMDPLRVHTSRRFLIIFILVLVFTIAIAEETEYHVDNSPIIQGDIILLNNERVRRDIAIKNTTTKNGIKSSFPITNNISTSLPPSTPTTASKNATQDTENTTLEASDNRTSLLGFNGTGILHDRIPSNTPTVSEPITPDDDTTDVFKDTLETIKAKNNLTDIQLDHHVFYNSTFLGNIEFFNEYWSNITKQKAEIHEVLSNSHRRATTINLSFDFIFYGNSVKNITVATGGFIFIGDHVHNWLAATQYIAPLMANFDTTLGKDSVVKQYDDGEKFVVFWENVTLQENLTSPFTFAVVLYKSGDIAFVYKDIPFPIQNISDREHPVKVGISDAYLTGQSYLHVKHKTIYEYHRVSFKSYEISNHTIIMLLALPSCLVYTTCEDCTNHDTNFNCSWCPNINKCSSGIDKIKHDWAVRHCQAVAIKEEKLCPAHVNHSSDTKNTMYTTDNSSAEARQLHTEGTPDVPVPKQQSTIGGVVSVLVIITLLASFAGWVLYAFKNPHTRSGQILIRYRPSQWTWRRGEARYTAATIHM